MDANPIQKRQSLNHSNVFCSKWSSNVHIGNKLINYLYPEQRTYTFVFLLTWCARSVQDNPDDDRTVIG